MTFKKNIFLSYALLVCTITSEAKISIQNMQNSVSNFLHRGKHEKNEQHEFKNIATLELFCDHGNISIHTWKQPSIMIETKKHGTSAQHTNTKVIFKQTDQLLQVQTSTEDKKNTIATHFNIIISENTHVKIATKQGNILIKNLLACVHAQTEHGNIDIIDGTNSSHVQTHHGNIMIQRESIESNTKIHAENNHGNITLQVPQHINSNIYAQAKHGKIYSDLLITVAPHTMKLTEETYKQQKHLLAGSITNNTHVTTTGNIELISQSGTIKIKPYV